MNSNTNQHQKFYQRISTSMTNQTDKKFESDHLISQNTSASANTHACKRTILNRRSSSFHISPTTTAYDHSWIQHSLNQTHNQQNQNQKDKNYTLKILSDRINSKTYQPDHQANHRAEINSCKNFIEIQPIQELEISKLKDQQIIAQFLNNQENSDRNLKNLSKSKLQNQNKSQSQQTKSVANFSENKTEIQQLPSSVELSGLNKLNLHAEIKRKTTENRIKTNISHKEGSTQTDLNYFTCENCCTTCVDSDLNFGHLEGGFSVNTCVNVFLSNNTFFGGHDANVNLPFFIYQKQKVFLRRIY